MATFGKVEYPEVYPGVNLVYYGKQGKLEYDFVLAAGADPKAIGLELETRNSKLEARKSQTANRKTKIEIAANGEVRFHKPLVYQEQESGVRSQKSGSQAGAGHSSLATRHFLDGRYVLSADNRIHFEVPGYDKSRPLIIDPVLDYSTYIGGSGGDLALGIAVDSTGSAYITGTTNSSNFPTKSAFQTGYKGSGDAFVSKFIFTPGTGTGTGLALVYSTYLGGAGTDSAAAIAVDASDDAFITGSTTSPDFPVSPVASGTGAANAFQTSYGGGEDDAFVAELGSGGDTLVYSSFLGGAGADFGQGIAVDGTGNAYVTGSTQSANFPTKSPLQAANAGGSDAFVAKVNFGGTALLYSTYLGGSASDVGQGVKVDSSGNAYVVGYTFSADFPLKSPLQAMKAGPADTADAFVAELNATGSALAFSTYLGGTADDRGFGIALDSSANIYVTGESKSTNFPTTPAAYQSSNKGLSDAFVTKLNAGGTSMVYSTYLGGTDSDQANSIAVDSSGDAFVAGFTSSSDFPAQNAVQSVLGITGGSSCGTSACPDAFVTELNPVGTSLVYSTYLGGSAADFGQGVALDRSGLAYVAGSTFSVNFPVIAGASYQGELKGVAGNAFVAKVDSANAPGMVIVPQLVDFGSQTESVRSAPLAVTIVDAGTDPLTISSVTSSNVDFVETDNCAMGIVPASGGNCFINVTFTPSMVGLETGTITITDSAVNSPHTFTVQGTGVTSATEVTFSPGSLTFGNQTVGTVSSPQTVTITNTGTATLTISTITTTGDYTQTNTCAAVLNTLNVGQSCTASVTFVPTASGARSGTLRISDNATGSPQSVSLTGNGVAVFSLSSTATTNTVVIGTTSATFTVAASGPASFTGSITLSCSAGATCSFSPASIFDGQSSTLTLSNLSASTTNPFNFTVSGVSGSESATLPLTLLLADYTLAGSPALDFVVPGGSAKYTITLTPGNGFNQSVTFGCTNLPIGAACSFGHPSVTPSGSPVTTDLTIITTVQPAASLFRRSPPGGLPLSMMWWVVFLGGLLALIRLERRLSARYGVPRVASHRWKLALAGGALALAALAGSCRNVIGTSGGTPPGNYIISVTGTLASNKAVVRTATIDLSVTPAPTM